MQLKNDKIAIEVATLGAELQSLKNVETGQEFLWQADPEVWPRYAPNLFPLVGRLRDDEYIIGEETYSLGQHGFAREKEFDVIKWNPSEVTFSLKSSLETYPSYPFDFELRIGYQLKGNKVLQSFEVINTGDEDLPFSFGAHPAFIADPIEEYRLEFSDEETEESDTVINGIRSGFMRSCFDGNSIHLSKSIFDKDALIFKGLKSQTITLKHNDGREVLSMTLNGFPYLGIWAKPQANYVCIEPWCGIADKHNHDKNLFTKEGIVVLPEGENYRREIELTLKS